MSAKRLYYKLSPELSDGEHWSIVDSPAAVVEAVTEHLKDHAPNCGGIVWGDHFEVEVVEMTPEEVAALPSI